ncbi:MAG: hypothetical protein EA423_01070 [Phycisphaerales bacterium]|nr:MAG: hypothetical protein EA423_01070 [Phycisphaerales bacterium]
MMIKRNRVQLSVLAALAGLLALPAAGARASDADTGDHDELLERLGRMTAGVARATHSMLAGRPIDGSTALADAEDNGAAERPAAAGGVTRTDDGAIIVDGNIRITGEGTQASPYRVPWDLLLNAQRVYDPRSGKEDAPEWVKLLDGKHVRISGYLLFPVVRDDVDELLLMMNQWDGCCLGLPPTAYDAVEVRLERPQRVSRWTTNFGTLTGKFQWDPYLSAGWLVGLYLITDAKLSDESGRNMPDH